jgi:hypothetical protein
MAFRPTFIKAKSRSIASGAPHAHQNSTSLGNVTPATSVRAKAGAAASDVRSGGRHPLARSAIGAQGAKSTPASA